MAVLGLFAAACADQNDQVSAPPLVTSSSSTTSSSPPDGDETATSTPVAMIAEIEQVECPADIAADHIACGVAEVALDPLQPGNGTTRITLATMQGYDSGFETPVAVLQGGPGGASSALAAWFPQQAFPQVFIDQRGTGFVGPDFDCREFDDSLGEVFASLAPEASTIAKEALDTCARRLGDDTLLKATTTQNHASDVASVMPGLGYERWVVYGVSYGSTIGLELLRQSSSGLVGAVLDGVYPPDIDIDAHLAVSASSSLAELGTACAGSAMCSSYTEDVVGTVETLMTRLDADPMSITLSSQESGLSDSVEVVLDGTRLAEFTFLLLYSEARLRYLPAILGAIEDGDESAARWLASVGARTMVSAYGANDEATHFAVQCHDRLPFTDGPGDDLAPFPAAITSAPLSDSCREWDRSDAYDIAGSPVVSAVPTLLLSGQFDPITPPALAESTASHLTNATVVSQQGRGHGIWFGNDCISSIVQDFVSDPARELDTSCAEVGVEVDWARP